MLLAVLNKSGGQHPTKQKLYGHLPFISKTIQTRRTRHVGHCWRSKGELISDILLWTPSHGRAKIELAARTYPPTAVLWYSCSMENMPKVIDDRYELLESVLEIRAGSDLKSLSNMIYIYMCVCVCVLCVSTHWPRSVEYSSIAQETRDLFQVELYQRLKNGTWCCLA